MLELVERAYFRLCLTLGSLLRAGRYSKTQIVFEHGELRVRKHRRFYAPLLVWLGDPLVRILDTGVRVLPQQGWEEREREIYRSLYDASIVVDANGTLVLPYLPGTTLAALLDDSALEESARWRAVELAVIALAEFHERGFTHGDAMAENVLVDLGRGVAYWFDFETVHDSGRSMAWRRADDVRALLTTSLVRTVPERIPETLNWILSVYPYEGAGRVLVSIFDAVFQRPLMYHLGQAPLSFESFRRIGRLLRERAGR